MQKLKQWAIKGLKHFFSVSSVSQLDQSDIKAISVLTTLFAAVALMLIVQLFVNPMVIVTLIALCIIGYGMYRGINHLIKRLADDE